MFEVCSTMKVSSESAMESINTTILMEFKSGARIIYMPLCAGFVYMMFTSLSLSLSRSTNMHFLII